MAIQCQTGVRRGLYTKKSHSVWHQTTRDDGVMFGDILEQPDTAEVTCHRWQYVSSSHFLDTRQSEELQNTRPQRTR